MQILTIGLNHKTAPVEVRERLAFMPHSLPAALKSLRQTKSILECAILSTCNRMELVVVCDQLHTARYYTKTFLEQWFRIEKSQFVDHLYFFEDKDAVQHLFEVTCGLDSMVLGETQILGQVREAMERAQEAGTTGTLLNKLFKQAVTVGKKAHSETEIGQNAVSISSAAIELGKRIFGDFSGKTVLILGAGKMGELTAKHLQANGAKKVIVANRTLERAKELATRISADVCSLSELESALAQSDVVISSTGSNGTILSKDLVTRTMQKRRHRSLFLIDIAVPRDIDPEVNQTENVFLYDIDDLQEIVTINKEARAKEAKKVKGFIAEETEAFLHWLQTLGVVPLITALREKALEAQGAAMLRIERKLPDLTERERKIISKQTKSIVNQLLRDPIMQIKELAGQPGASEALDMFEKIFALQDFLPEDEEYRRSTREARQLKMSQVSIRS